MLLIPLAPLRVQKTLHRPEQSSTIFFLLHQSGSSTESQSKGSQASSRGRIEGPVKGRLRVADELRTRQVGANSTPQKIGFQAIN
jgi:hypothetical protein